MLQQLKEVCQCRRISAYRAPGLSRLTNGREGMVWQEAQVVVQTTHLPRQSGWLPRWLSEWRHSRRRQAGRQTGGQRCWATSDLCGRHRLRQLLQVDLLLDTGDLGQGGWVGANKVLNTKGGLSKTADLSSREDGLAVCPALQPACITGGPICHAPPRHERRW